MNTAKLFQLAIYVFLIIALHANAAPQVKRASLLDVYHDAVMYNSDIAAARADYEAKQEATPQAIAGLLPQINAGGSLERSRTRLKKVSTNYRGVQKRTEIINDYGGSLFQANVSQPIFRLDRWFQLSAAKNSVIQAEYEYAEKEQLLILQAAEYYFEILRASDILATTKAEEEAYKAQLAQTKGRLKGGVSTITDVLDAQAAYDMAKANRELADRKVNDAFEQLTRLTHQQYEGIDGISHGLPVLPPVPNISKTWADTAMRQNLSILASEYNVKTAKETYKQRQAGHAPTVDLTASYRKGDNDPLGYSNTTSSSYDRYEGTVTQSNISLQLNVPIFTGGMVSSQAREARKRLLQSEQLFTTQQREVLLRTRNFFRALNSDIEQIKARKQTMISSYEAVKANEIGYRVGTRNMTDVLNAQRQLYSAVRDYNNARYDYILDNLRLKQMAGTLKVEDLEDLADFLLTDYDPDKDFLPRNLKKQTKLTH